MCISDTGIMELEGMRFHAYHGCLEKERQEGSLFTVDFRGTLDISKSTQSDSLEDTVDYGLIYGIIKDEMQHPSNLLEHVAARICKALGKRFPQFTNIEIRISKHNPPVEGACEWSRITASWKKEQ